MEGALDHYGHALKQELEITHDAASKTLASLEDLLNEISSLPDVVVRSSVPTAKPQPRKPPPTFSRSSSFATRAAFDVNVVSVGEMSLSGHNSTHQRMRPPTLQQNLSRSSTAEVFTSDPSFMMPYERASSHNLLSTRASNSGAPGDSYGIDSLSAPASQLRRSASTLSGRPQTSGASAAAATFSHNSYEVFMPEEPSPRVPHHMKRLLRQPSDNGASARPPQPLLSSPSFGTLPNAGQVNEAHRSMSGGFGSAGYAQQARTTASKAPASSPEAASTHLAIPSVAITGTPGNGGNGGIIASKPTTPAVRTGTVQSPKSQTLARSNSISRTQPNLVASSKPSLFDRLRPSKRV